MTPRSKVVHDGGKRSLGEQTWGLARSPMHELMDPLVTNGNFIRRKVHSKLSMKAAAAYIEGMADVGPWRCAGDL